MKTGSPLQGLQAGAVIHFPLQLGALFPVIYHLTTVFVCFPLGREPGGLVLGTPPPDALTTTAAVSSRRGRWPQASGTRHPSSLPAQPSPRDLLLLGEARSQQSQPSSQVLQEPCGTLWKRRKNHPECVGPTEEEFSARDLRPHCLACFPALSESHLCQKVIISVLQRPPGLLVPWCVALPADIGMVEVSHVLIGLQT
ncbi:uncharacterized protein LOC113486553 isoform X6 [Athene cunicularia]|uniref:uncharacterized protein LOC113486553 isoform X6 n=1 Tax=Athene cunicularia TaxID=194338 RepID=UPI000EF64FEC|nr:uncharacterized protein LOC113486553 isoform X6 [Athene cunicularia]